MEWDVILKELLREPVVGGSAGAGGMATILFFGKRFFDYLNGRNKVEEKEADAEKAQVEAAYKPLSDVSAALLSVVQTNQQFVETLKGMDEGIVKFAGASAEQHATTRSHISKQGSNLTVALELFANTQKEIVKELKIASEINSNLLKEFEVVKATATTTAGETKELNDKADKIGEVVGGIMNTLNSVDLKQIIELLEAIRADSKRYYEETNKRLDGIETQIKPIVEKETKVKEQSDGRRNSSATGTTNAPITRPIEK